MTSHSPPNGKVCRRPIRLPCLVLAPASVSRYVRIRLIDQPTDPQLPKIRPIIPLAHLPSDSSGVGVVAIPEAARRPVGQAISGDVDVEAE